MKLLGVDFGLSNFGLAVSIHGLVEPLAQFKTESLAEAIERIAKVAKEEEVDKIVVGLPEGELREKAQQFGQQLEKATGLALVFHDESLSSQTAVVKMVQAGKPRKKRQQQQDMIAACVILEDFLTGGD